MKTTFTGDKNLGVDFGGREMTKFAILSDVRTTPADEDGNVLINLESGKIFSLNDVGAKVWTMLEHGLTLEHIIESLVQEYCVSRQEIQEDVEIFIHGLECKGLGRATEASRSLGEKEPANGIAA
jgi:hypothetical protein